VASRFTWPSTPDVAEVALVLRHLVRAIRRHWPAVDILIRGDSHYGRSEALDWLERSRVGYVFGLGGNSVPLGKLRALAEDAPVARIEDEGGKVRRFGAFRYAARSWPVDGRSSPGSRSRPRAATHGSSSPTSRARRVGSTRRSTAPKPTREPD